MAPSPPDIDLRALRRRAGLTQAELGRRVGTTQSAVARWERGAVSPTLQTGQRLAQACQERLDLVPASRPAAEPDELDDAERARLAANLELTPAERLDRLTTAANFLFRGRRAVAEATASQPDA